MTLTGDAELTYSATNGGTQSTTANMTSTNSIAWSSTLAAINTLVTSHVDKFIGASGSQTYAVGQTRSFGPDTFNSTDSYFLNSLLPSLEAAGGGAFSITCKSSTTLAVLTTGSFTGSGTASDGCGAEIDYTYTSGSATVPEPGSIALVAIALAGAGVSTRRRKA